MLLNEVLEKYNSIMSIYMVDEEEGTKELELFKKEFESKFKIIPKEEFGVIFNREDAGRLVCGGFSSKEEAERYKDGWNKKAEEKSLISSGGNTNFLADKIINYSIGFIQKFENYKVGVL